jgi:parvulin-like peptidyl-prolyl isomerase
MRILSLIAVVILAALVAAGCGSDSKASPRLCSVNGSSFDQRAFDQLLDQQKRAYKASSQKFPAKGTSERKAAEQQIIDTLVQQTLLAQIAADLDVKVTDKQVDERVDELIDTAFEGDRARYEKEIAKQGMTESIVHENVRQQLINEKVFAKLGEDIKLTEKQIHKSFDETSELYNVPSSRKVAHILVADAKTAARVRKLAMADPDNTRLFASLAKKYSTDKTTSSLGGQLTVEKGQTTPAFDQAAFALRTGEVSKIVHTEYGYHIIQAMADVQPARRKPYKEVRSAVASTLRQSMQTERLQKLLTSKQEKAKVSCEHGYSWKAPASASDSKSKAAARP